jgi:hypothetical protein
MHFFATELGIPTIGYSQRAMSRIMGISFASPAMTWSSSACARAASPRSMACW